MKKKVIIAVGLAAVAAAAWLLMRGGSDTPDDAASNGRSGKGRDGQSRMLAKRSDGGVTKASKAIDEARGNISSGNWTSKRRVGISHAANIESTWTDEDGNPWPKAQIDLMRTVVNAAEEGDFAAVAALAKKVEKCDNPELRQKYVDELGWFGEQAFVELASFISDSDDAVADSARSHLTDAFQEIETDTEKAAVYTLMTRAVNDKEMLESLSEELVAMDELMALQAIVDTIDDGTANAQEAAKAAYKLITDEDWTDIDAAEVWLSENYDGDDGVDNGGDDGVEDND